jgi:ribosomal protein S18 acetylase RimI-like enzyme
VRWLKDWRVGLKAYIHLRLAGAQDAANIADVARRTWKDTYAEIILPANQERFLGRWYTPAALGEAMGRSGSWFYVAAAGEEVIGFAQFMMREDRRGELTRIYVLPEWQQQGAGSHLLKEGLDALSMYGAEEMFVHVEKDNAKGTGFYERRGFHRVRAFSLEFPEQKLETLEYVLSLGVR